MARSTGKADRRFEDRASSSLRRTQENRRVNLKARRTARIAVVLFFVLLAAVGGFLIYLATGVLSGLTTSGITEDPKALGIDLDNAEIVRDKSVKNIALFGVDKRNDAFEGNSDMIMILTIDNKHDKIKMTSVLRDSYVRVEGNTITGDHMDWQTRINEAYFYGGPELAIRTLNQTFGLDITDYVTINFANMAAIVDAFGGVDLYVTAEETREINKNLWALSREVLDQVREDMEIGIYGKRKYPEIVTADYVPTVSGERIVDSSDYQDGVLHLNGNRAVAYSRIRQAGTDPARVQRQQKVFRKLIGKIRSLRFSDYPGVIREMLPFCETSLDLSDIVDYTPILSDKMTIESISVPNARYETDLRDGMEDFGTSYVLYDVTPAAKRISSFIYEEMSPYWVRYGNTAEVPEENTEE